MQIEDRSLERAYTATSHSWCDPIAMFIAWLARLFDQIAKMKRIRHNTKFKANWRDHFPGLVQCEWLRDQVLAAGAARLLAGKSLYEDFDFIPSTEPPADYGGPCPRTPQLMNRRFLAVARFNADPEAAIRKHAQRIAKREGINLSDCPLRLAARSTSPMLRMEEETHAPQARCLSSSGAARRGRWHAPARDGGGSHRSRGPPTFPTRHPAHLSAPPLRMPPRACRSAPNPGNDKVSPLTGRITRVVSHQITGVPCKPSPKPRARSWKRCGASRR